MQVEVSAVRVLFELLGLLLGKAFSYRRSAFSKINSKLRGRFVGSGLSGPGVLTGLRDSVYNGASFSRHH